MKHLTGVFTIILCLIVGTGNVYAHSFTVALIAPSSGANMEIGVHVRDGFLRATRERDSHPNEESDGHLGGLDVYLIPIDAALEPQRVLTAVEMLLQAQQIEFIAAVSFSRTEELRRVVAGTKTLFIELGQNLMSNEKPIISDSNSSVFESEFRRDFGYEPSQHAMLGYNIARLIDEAIRRNGEDLSDVENLGQSLKTVQSRY